MGYFYTPGYDRCSNAKELPYGLSSAFGNYYTQTGLQSTEYGTNAYTSGAGSVAIGDHAFAGGDPFSASPGASGSSDGIDGQVPLSAFSNANTTAIGQGARAGAAAAGEDNSTAVGSGALANATNASAFGQGAQANATNSVAIGFGSVANAANTVSVGAVGAERKIVNVAGGTVASSSTDALNGSQLFTANQRVAAAFGGGATVDGGGQLTMPSYLIAGMTYNDVGGAFAAVNAQLGSGGSLYFKANSAGPAAAATGREAIAIGSGSNANGDNSIALGANSQAIQTNAIALGTNATATAANSAAIGAGSTNTAANTVSFGSSGNERRLTNVAAGINPTDAVNVGQLQSTVAGFGSQIGGLQSQINDNRWEARGGVALALASGSLRYDDRPGKWSLAGAFGSFKGAAGLALGLGYAATDRMRFNASVSGVPAQGEIGGAVAGSLTLN